MAHVVIILQRYCKNLHQINLYMMFCNMFTVHMLVNMVCGIRVRTEPPQLVINNIQHLKCQLRWRGSLHVHGKYTIKPSTEMYRDI